MVAGQVKNLNTHSDDEVMARGSCWEKGGGEQRNIISN